MTHDCEAHRREQQQFVGELADIWEDISGGEHTKDSDGDIVRAGAHFYMAHSYRENDDPAPVGIGEDGFVFSAATHVPEGCKGCAAEAALARLEAAANRTASLEAEVTAANFDGHWDEKAAAEAERDAAHAALQEIKEYMVKTGRKYSPVVEIARAVLGGPDTDTTR